MFIKLLISCGSNTLLITDWDLDCLCSLFMGAEITVNCVVFSFITGLQFTFYYLIFWPKLLKKKINALVININPMVVKHASCWL